MNERSGAAILALTPRPSPRGPSAGDLLLQQVDAWLLHCDEPHSGADADECDACGLLLSRIKAAHSVWRRSQYQAVSGNGHGVVTT